MNRAVENTSPLLKPKKRKLGKVLWDQKWLLVMSVPVLLYVFLFNYYPLWGWRYAFQNLDLYTIKKGADWIGFGNFEWLFNEKYFWLGFRNTLAMSLINLVFGTLASILLAILLNEVRTRAFKRTVQTVTYLPHFLSMVIVVGMAQNMFVSDGPINQMLLSLGIIDKPIWWLGEGKYFWFLVGLINIWKEVGWNSIIYISTMTSIDPTLYEASAIDGAGKIRQFFSVTLPSIMPSFWFLLMTRIIGSLQMFDIVYTMTGGGPSRSTTTMVVYIYEQAFNSMNKTGYATAMSEFLFAGIMLVTCVMYYIMNKTSD